MRRLLLIALLLLMSTLAYGDAAPTPNGPGRNIRVLLVGNSLIYVNNMPGLLRVLAASQSDGTHIETTTFVAPGGSVAVRWEDGNAAEALRNGKWDVLVLQERGGLLACMAGAEQRQESSRRNSQLAHHQFAELAKSRDTRVLLLATWGPDTLWQQKLDRGIRAIARSSDAELLPTGTVLRGMPRRIRNRRCSMPGFIRVCKVR